MAAEQFEAFGVEGRVPPGRMAAAAVAFRSWIEARWPGALWHREWPLVARTPEGSILRGYADLVLETSEGYVVIDHKCLSGGLDSALAAAAAYHGQLDAYADVVSRATARPVLSRWIHLPFQGVVVEVSAAS
jgi:ATP-dependent exoDNAse (exonuclease V) beta subunit